MSPSAFYAVNLVEDAGFIVIEVANADEAIAILESRKDIRIVFTDIDMPGSMDGLKLARAVRELEANPRESEEARASSRDISEIPRARARRVS